MLKLWVFLLVFLSLIFPQISLAKRCLSLTKENIKKAYDQDGYDKIYKDGFLCHAEIFLEKHKNVNPPKEGLAFKDKDTQEYLKNMIEVASSVQEYMGLAMHYEGILLIYKKYPRDIRFALEKTALSTSEIKDIRAILNSSP